jgi:L-threonylcarbamoyladenylate synthase
MVDARFTNDVARAAQRIQAGDLVAFPTETVYGLGADARNEAAVRKVFAAKGRPADHPLIVHTASTEAAKAWAATWPATAQQLAAAFWPGPMTLIVKAAPSVPAVVTGGQDSVGLRVPAHPVALALLRVSQRAIAAPSANKFGHVSPTRAEHVASEFGEELQTILIGADCEVGVESTIIDCTVNPVRILRPGRITASDVARVVGTLGSQHGTSADAPRVSGSLASHYAPRTPTHLMTPQAFLARNADRTIGTITFTVHPAFEGTHRACIGQTPAQVEHDLYALLRELDAAPLSAIWIETPPAGEAWDAVRDRLSRAAHHNTTESTA